MYDELKDKGLSRRKVLRGLAASAATLGAAQSSKADGLKPEHLSESGPIDITDILDPIMRSAQEISSLEHNLHDFLRSVDEIPTVAVRRTAPWFYEIEIGRRRIELGLDEDNQGFGITINPGSSEVTVSFQGGSSPWLARGTVMVDGEAITLDFTDPPLLARASAVPQRPSTPRQREISTMLYTGVIKAILARS